MKVEESGSPAAEPQPRESSLRPPAASFWRLTNARIALVGLVAGALCAFSIAAVSASDGDVLPPEKQAAVDNASDATSTLVEPVGPTYEWRDQAPDQGPEDDVAAVKQASETLLSAELTLAAMPASVSKREKTETERVDAAEDGLGDIWDDKALEDQTDELTDALGDVVDDPTYLAYRDARFVVTGWWGVTVDGDQASATLMGHDEFLPVGSTEWTPEPDNQVQLTLARESAGAEWKLVDRGYLSKGDDDGNQ